jgi:hypothetical protein
MTGLNSYRLSEVEIDLGSVIDCRVLGELGTPVDELIQDTDYRVTQSIAKSAISTGAEGIIVPSATRLGDNLVIFPDHMKPGSRLEVIGSRDPVLYVERL